LWCKLPANAGRRKDNRPWPGALQQVDLGLKAPLAVETWEPFSAPLADAAGGTSEAASSSAQDAAAHSPADQTAGETAGQGAASDTRTVLLVHGWGGWRGQVAAFVKPLTAAGFRVVAIDSLSHGDSGPGRHGPKYSSGGELMRSLEAWVAQNGNPYGVIAHSLGCAATCRMLLRGTLQAERLVLVSPSPDMRKMARRFAKSLGFKERATRLMNEEMEKRAQGSLADFDIGDMGATGQLGAALVIHDSVDKESPYAVSEDIAARWEGARLVTTQGLGHHRILIDPAVVELAGAYMAGDDQASL
jgi:pimeloyl-ACP methyl ester carboxylesterase